MSIKRTLRSCLINLPGWRTKRKIVVIESDDWGALRTPSKEVLEKLRKSGMAVDQCHYMLNDSLASEEDLSMLFEIILQHRNAFGQTPVITANCLIANPDFEKIRASHFQEYYYEHFTETLARYPNHSQSFKLWQKGIAERLFYPQSHGREHLNIPRWMQDLQAGVKETRLAFDLDMFGISGHISTIKRGSYLAALDGGKEEFKYNRTEIIKEALIQFKNTFGYPSISFIAPNYVWDDTVESCLADQGVLYLQGSTVQRYPKAVNAPVKTKRHFQGQMNKRGQRYLVRNAHFEPSLAPGKDWVSNCLKEIAFAFFWKKPAIIATHRVNFIGSIDPFNRDRNLRLLDELLRNIVKCWPKAEFMTSDQLGNVMNENTI